MDFLDEYIQWAFNRLPQMATTKDLRNIGLYNSDQAAAAARRKGLGPQFFRIHARVILYPKNAVIDFLTRSKCSPRKNKYAR